MGRMSTHEPKQLPRRGRRGGWMRDPQRGVAKLDGTNSAQRAWLAERSATVDEAFVAKLKATDGCGDAQEVFDQHLAAMDAIHVAVPGADEFRLPHLRRLARTPKVNPVHEAAVASPPVHVPAAPQDLPDVEASKKQRGRRRGRFIGHRERLPKQRPEMEVRGTRKAAWDSDTEDEDQDRELFQ